MAFFLPYKAIDALLFVAPLYGKHGLKQNEGGIIPIK
jgi:hypothetical protein